MELDGSSRVGLETEQRFIRTGVLVRGELGAAGAVLRGLEALGHGGGDEGGGSISWNDGDAPRGASEARHHVWFVERESLWVWSRH